MERTEYVINKSSFEFVNLDSNIHDNKLDTKPVGYLRDALRRFAKNKGSVVAAGIILILVLFAIIAPMASDYTVSFRDPYFRTTLPICTAAKNNPNMDFWDGCSEVELAQTTFELYYGINVESGQEAVKRGEYTVRQVTRELKNNKTRVDNLYTFRLNSYYKVGAYYKNLTLEEYRSIQEYQDRTGKQVLYPVVAKKERVTALLDQLDPSTASSKTYINDDGNFWYKVKISSKAPYTPTAVFDENGNYINNYAVDPTSDKDLYTSKMLVEGDTKQYLYGIKNQNGFEVRINYYEYFCYVHYMAGDGIESPHFIFGTNGDGQDIFTCLAAGARFSFLLAILVSIINLTLGAIYGAIEGYYGGLADICMERISDILGAIPMMIVLTLVRLQLSNKTDIPSQDIALVSMIISFLATGWIGMASSVRMQFYRFKNQEYVLAARTLGARDRRIILKHILPNSLGTLITGSVLVIPGVMFSESSLAYLGILDLSTSTSTSIGVLLANGQPYLTTYPHVILFPALFISLLMLSFNLFGNGLRDAFNPQLRGSEG
ncbi:MAG: ABC transporter permease [Clostridia bacterium]|nr:ABC transporter permease [Clostridia bacterium]